MAKSNPTPPDAGGPKLKDPRSISAMDNIGVDNQGDLLDEELDDSIGDRGNGKRIFSDDVRSDEIGGIPDRDH